MKFFKMHAQGNDYVYFDQRAEGAPRYDLANMARIVSHRHTGVGGDGMVMLLPPADEGADAAFRMWNADGSEAEICGSALRCVTHYLCGEMGVISVTLETQVGLRRGELRADGVRVDMGKPGQPRKMNVEGLEGWFVNMGNPHLVLFSGHPDAHELRVLGPRLEHSVASGVNVHMAHVLDSETIMMLTWERGTGMTMACGSGACAVAQAAVNDGVHGDIVTIQQAGGVVRVQRDVATGHMWLEGAVSMAFSGVLSNDLMHEITQGNG